MEKAKEEAEKNGLFLPKFVVKNVDDELCEVHFDTDCETVTIDHAEKFNLNEGETIEIHKLAFPYPEIQQKIALEHFKGGSMVNPELQQEIMDISHLKYKDNGRRIHHLYNSSISNNRSQLNALAKSAASGDIFLIQGPPGSGKTTVIRELIYQELEKDPDARILVVSQANVAVDNVLRNLAKPGVLESSDIIRCGNEGTVAEDLKPYMFDKKYDIYIKQVNESICSTELLPYREIWKSLVNDSETKNQITEYLLKDYSVVGATCVGLAKRNIGLDRLSFDLVVADEAGKALPGELLIPVNRAKKIVLIGDHKQLPPVVDSVLYSQDFTMDDVVDENLTDNFFSSSLFERLYNQCPQENKCMLDTQFRMPKVIGDFISREFYDSKLKSGKVCSDKVPLFLGKFMTLIDMDLDARIFITDEGNQLSYREREDQQGVHRSGPYNPCEALVVKKLVQRLRQYYHGRIVIITPYKKQRNEIIKLFPNRNNDLLVVDTIDRFQGDEADIVIYCMTRAEKRTKYFSDNARLNVAISRTKNTIIFIGAGRYLLSYGENHPLYHLYNYIRNNGVILNPRVLRDDGFDWKYRPQNKVVEQQSETAPVIECKPDVEVRGAGTASFDIKPQKKECRICHKEYLLEQLHDGVCDKCLREGELFPCAGCGKENAAYIPYDALEEPGIHIYCENCQKKVPLKCKYCGNTFYILQGEKLRLDRKGKGLPNICRECRKPVIIGHCRVCGKPIEMMRGQYNEFTKNGIQFWSYCKEHATLVPAKCDGCGCNIDIPAGKKLILERSRKPIFCSDCNTIGKVATCEVCGKDIQMKRGRYKKLVREGKFVPICLNCKDRVYTTRTCRDCNEEFDITYGEKYFYEKKNYNLPWKCQRCRRKNK